jgi:hypothetical protein
MATFAVQYLEAYNPRIHTQKNVLLRLRQAFQRLPISMVILGWNVPPDLTEACSMEAAVHGAYLYRWHPLLSGHQHPEWQVKNPYHNTIAGYQQMPEFTFSCPNRPEVREAVLENLDRVLGIGIYQGMFLDRIRFPSPSTDPLKMLGCFCECCRRAAADYDLDLEEIRRKITSLPFKEDQSILAMVNLLLAKECPDFLLSKFMKFRQVSIGKIVRLATEAIRAKNLAIGFDCFSPCLAQMVGQDLTELGRLCDWLKPMVYTHTYGPAGIPFELGCLADWLVARGIHVTETLEHLAWMCGGPLLEHRDHRSIRGLSDMFVEIEIRRARRAVRKKLLAGLSLIELAGINHLTSKEVRDETTACYVAGADGLVLSWDLWFIPLSRLTMVASGWNWI